MKIKLLLVLGIAALLFHQQIESFFKPPTAITATAAAQEQDGLASAPTPGAPAAVVPVAAASPSPALRFFEEKGYTSGLDGGSQKVSYHAAAASSPTPDPSARMKRMIISGGGGD
jgi:hypothetical protein